MLTGRPPASAGCDHGGAPEWLRLAEQTIAGADIDDLRLVLAAGAFALGRLAPEDAGRLAGITADALTQQASAVERCAAPRISVVIPVLNEAETLPALHSELQAVLRTIGSYEILFVDDGSTDRSVQLIRDLQASDSSVQLIRLSRNFGHQAALSAGLDHATGQAVIFMDCDLQDPPALLPQLVEKWEEGNEVVYAVRRRRQEGAAKRAAYFVFYRLLRRMSDVQMPVDAGDFCLIDRRVADELRHLPERSRFLRGLRSWVGFQQVGVPYDRPARVAGSVKFTLRRLVALGADGLFAFSTVPLRVASLIGIATASAGVVYTAWAVFDRLFVGKEPKGWASLIAIVLVIGGVQLVVTGVLGEYLARVYMETKRRPLYIVREHERSHVGR